MLAAQQSEVILKCHWLITCSGDGCQGKGEGVGPTPHQLPEDKVVRGWANPTWEITHPRATPRAKEVGKSTWPGGNECRHSFG